VQCQAQANRKAATVTYPELRRSFRNQCSTARASRPYMELSWHSTISSQYVVTWLRIRYGQGLKNSAMNYGEQPKVHQDILSSAC
jgi:hypothetical protein